MLGRSEAEFWDITPAKAELLSRLRDKYEPSTEDGQPQDQPAPNKFDDPMDLFRLASMQIG